MIKKREFFIIMQRSPTTHIERSFSMENNTCLVEWYKGSKTTPCLKFTFTGKFDSRTAQNAIRDWRRLFSEKPNQKICIIWDATQMTSYEPQVRKVWQQELTRSKNQIDRVWLISGSGLIRMGASLLSAFTSISLKSVKSIHEIRI